MAETGKDKEAGALNHKVYSNVSKVAQVDLLRVSM
jgi:hypothetical protein